VPEKLSPEEAQRVLTDKMWASAETRPLMEEAMLKLYPDSTRATLPHIVVREELGKARDELRTEIEKDRGERAAERARRAVEDEKRAVMNDPDLRIREDEFPAVEELMKNEVVGTYKAGARLYRATQQVASPTTGAATFGTMEVPGMDGGDEFKWLTPGIGNRQALDQVTRRRAYEIFNDMQRGNAHKYLG